jgi:hypothetical protein
VPNSVGRLAPGIDVRGERGQVGAPPSRVKLDRFRVHNGEHVYDEAGYEWLNDQPIQFIRAELLIPLDEIQDYEGRPSPLRVRGLGASRSPEQLPHLDGGLPLRSGDSAEDVLFQIKLESERLHFTPRDGELEAIVRSGPALSLMQPAPPAPELQPTAVPDARRAA